MTEPLSAVEAELVLSPHLQKIGGCIELGWRRWLGLLKQDSELGIVISTRSRANLVYDFIRYEAVNAFDGCEDIKVGDSRGFLLLTFEEKIVLRFKKFKDRRLRTSGVPTQQRREYANQVLPGMEALTHLVAGYLPDKTGLGLERMAIACSLDDDQLWVLELDLGLGETGVAAPVAPMPSAPPRDTIVRPKRREIPDQTGTEER
ncbi:hypothetical protein [Streptomyces brevispora]|uniref:Uncharacterized protein n=1 Tax=Streptomyces brevispora TaxID=887462 RepID=A0ABZ1G690_9ACTN|nr:hypothetical protein [Streptomyces brevispora]WSC14773.1 hypothetical protein OIE64_19335 [Streptomyces brevispora]